MAKGQKTKAGHIIQMIWHGADPNRFNPNGKRVVCHNAEDYDFIEGIEFDKLSRKGAKALIANVPLEEMWTGKLSGPLHYNLMDDQIFPFWIAKGVETPISVGGVPCIDTEYARPQLDRADRVFFSIEEGKAGGGADLGCYGMFTSFKWTSKRGNKGKSRFEVGFATQAAVPRPNLTGGTAQNHKTRITAANVSNALSLLITAPGLAPKTVSLAIGDTAAQIKAKFLAEGMTVNASGGVVVGAGQVDSVGGTGAALSVNHAGKTAVAVDYAQPTNALVLTDFQTRYRTSDAARAGAVVAGTFTRPVLGIPISFEVNGTVDASGIYSKTAQVRSAGEFYFQNGTKYAWFENGYWTIANGQSGSGTLYAFNGTGGNIGGGGPTTRKDDVAVQGQSSSPSVNNVQRESGTLASASFTITHDAAKGSLGNVIVTGAGYNGNTTAPGGAGGAVDLEFTNPGNALVSVSKSGAGAGYVLSTPQPGSDGSILQSMLPDDPIMPGHLFLYSAETPLGLEDEANLVGQIEEWEIDDPKICLPVSHHVRVNDPERPTLPATYNAHAEEESQEDGIKLSVTMDADEGGIVEGMKALLRASGSRLVSVPRYWRIAAIHPGSPRRVFIDFYGSVGASVPVKWAGSIEQYTFVYDLLENKTAPWNFKAKTRRPV